MRIFVIPMTVIIKDIGSGFSDEINGRFEELGWARSFEIYGYINIKVVWKGKIENNTKKKVNCYV